MSKKKYRTPDFLGIGVMKGGSTWTWQQMRQHPQIGLPNKHGKKTKEIHFFDRLNLTLKKYMRRLGELGNNKVGEFTPNYFACPYAPVMIKSLFPKTKLFAILRNPTDRAFSHYKDHYFNGKIPSDVKFIDAFVGDYPKVELKFYSIKSKGMYGDLLENWYNYFSPSQLKIFFYDDLCSKPVDFLKSIFEWIEVDPNFLPLDYKDKVVKKYNKAYDDMKIDPLDRAKVSEFYAPQIKKLSNLLNQPINWH